MRDLFLCPRNSLLANWVEACPEAQVYASLSAIQLPRKEPYVFWLHADINQQQWIVASIAQIMRDYLGPKIVILANVPDQAEALLALGQGAVGYCHAYSPPAVLTEVRTVITHGGIWLGRELLQHLIAVSSGLVSAAPQQVAQTLALLTAREQEVALEAAKGASNKDIARKLDITVRTVKAHLSSAFERLGVKDRLQLALMLNDRSAR